MPMSLRSRQKLKDRIATLALILYALMSILPVVWLVLSSFKSAGAISDYPPKIFFIPTLQTYFEIISQGILKYIGNSLIIGVSTMLLTLGVSIPAAYVISRTPFRGSQNVAFWVLTTRMIPPVVVSIPIFLTAYYLGLYDTHLMLIIMYSGFNLSFSIWMLRGVFEGIPKSIDEAAMLDGCSRMGTLVRMILPLAASGIIATAIFVFIMSWNEFVLASILTSTNAITTPTFLAGSITPYYVVWERLFASSVLTIIPPITLSLVVQKYIIKALTFGYA